MPKIKKTLEVIDINNEDDNYEEVRNKISNIKEEEIKEEEIKEDKIKKVINKALNVPCPDCGKLVSKKTLKYTHKYQCVARNKQPNKIEDLPNKKTEESIIINKPKKYDHFKLF